MPARWLVTGPWWRRLPSVRGPESITAGEETRPLCSDSALTQMVPDFSVLSAV